ncbi:DUF202 domain-containing protein [Terrabacter terrae]
MRRPADVGMQAERTSLAWRRTALSVTVGSLVGLRVLPPQLGALGYAVSALGLVWGLNLALTARRRYRDGARLLRTRAGATTAGTSLMRTAVTSGMFAVVALTAVLVLALR